MEYIESSRTPDISNMDNETDNSLDITFAQGMKVLDMISARILEMRKKSKSQNMGPNFYFDCEIPAWMINDQTGFARVTVNGDAYNINFHRGVPETGIIGISKTLH